MSSGFHSAGFFTRSGLCDTLVVKPDEINKRLQQRPMHATFPHTVQADCAFYLWIGQADRWALADVLGEGYIGCLNASETCDGYRVVHLARTGVPGS